MRKNSTLSLKNNLLKKQTNKNKQLINKNYEEFEPSSESIQFIISYVKSTKCIKSNTCGNFLISLN